PLAALTADAVADALARILENDGFAADLAARGRARAAGFSWRRCAEQHAALYRATAAAVTRP
ncbi:MAG: hypothetical protein KDE27_08490, partial [Planctomycetes bacterium]|nr:hypothetical protein [Planctomycetota bacterium]